jgi:excisionase family DNA binding protein
MTTRTTNGSATKASTGSGAVGSEIDRVLQDLLELEKVQLAEIPRILSALEHTRARLWLVALRALADTERARSPSAPGPRLLTVKEVAERIQYSSGHVYELVRSGHLRVIRHGRTIRVPGEALAEWQAANQEGRLDDSRRSLGESGADDPAGALDHRSTPRAGRAPARRHGR